MKFFKVAMVLGVAAIATGAAQAADPNDGYTPSADPSMTGLYLRGDLGGSMLNWDGGDDDKSYVFGGGVGNQFTDFIRADITADRSGKYEIGPGADITTTTVLGNAYFDLNNSTMFTPYVGGGVGYGWVNGSGAATDDKGLALGLAAGVTVDVTTNMALDVGYRFRNVMLDGDDTREHQATAGIRFRF